MSNTPDNALPYSAGKAPVKKSELPSTCELIAAITPPPTPVISEKCVGLTASMPSNRHYKNIGELPRIEIPLLLIPPETPAKAVTKRAGSSKPPA